MKVGLELVTFGMTQANALIDWAMSSLEIWTNNVCTYPSTSHVIKYRLCVYKANLSKSKAGICCRRNFKSLKTSPPFNVQTKGFMRFPNNVNGQSKSLRFFIYIRGTYILGFFRGSELQIFLKDAKKIWSAVIWLASKYIWWFIILGFIILTVN